MTPDETVLVRQLQQGNPQGFETLYARYGDRIYRFSLRLCGNRADAEDLMQEVFLAALRGQERFQGHSSLATWLYRIALYRWKRLYSGKGARQLSLDSQTHLAADTPDPAQVGLDRLQLSQALDGLSEDLRTAFVLVKAEGLTYREAADILQIPQGTVQSRVHDAARSLRRQLENQDLLPSSPSLPSLDLIPQKGGNR